MVKAWSHLPNAHHIDWVLESVEENPELWDAAWDVASRCASWDAITDAAWDAVLNTAWDAARSAAWDAAWDTARAAARAAARSVISALVAYDDCDQFLNMPYEKLKVWTVLSEDLRAILLLPMVYVRERLNEQRMVTLA